MKLAFCSALIPTYSSTQSLEITPSPERYTSKVHKAVSIQLRERVEEWALIRNLVQGRSGIDSHVACAAIQKPSWFLFVTNNPAAR